MTAEHSCEKPEIRSAVRDILISIGEDPEREGLKNTPERVERMYREILCGYTQNLDEVVNGAVFQENCSGMVLMRNISFYSLCEHHMLPFFGIIHIAYVPDGRVIGLSKLPRIVEMYARRLQLQERLTAQIARTIEQVLEPKGIAIVCKGRHLCASMRGVHREQAEMVTNFFSGVFETDQALRKEFFSEIAQKEKTDA